MKESSDVWSVAEEKKLKTFPLEDMQSTSRAIKALQWLAPAAKTGEQPFFIAVGAASSMPGQICRSVSRV